MDSHAPSMASRAFAAWSAGARCLRGKVRRLPSESTEVCIGKCGCLHRKVRNFPGENAALSHNAFRPCLPCEQKEAYGALFFCYEFYCPCLPCVQKVAYRAAETVHGDDGHRGCRPLPAALAPRTFRMAVTDGGHEKNGTLRNRMPCADYGSAGDAVLTERQPFIASRMKLRKSGWGWSTVLVYSGWNCAPMYHRSSGISTISTRFDSGLRPVHFMPASSKLST